MESLSMNGKTICLPFPSEDEYESLMRNAIAFRQFLTTMYGQYPELFPVQMSNGFTFHDFTPPSKKQNGFQMRRIMLSDGEAYQIRPSFMMPYLIEKTDEVEKALFLRKWGVPFSALTYVFGRDDMFWYRAYVSQGRNSIVGTTVKDPDRLPEHIRSDEKHTRFKGDKVYVPTTVAQECILGAGLADNAGTKELTREYGQFKKEACNLKPDYEPKTANTDGWEHTRNALKNLFPGITLILCFLHAFLKIRDRCRRYKDQLRAISGKVWDVYHAETVAQFSQRIRRLREWADTITIDVVREKVLALCDKAPEFKKAYSHPESYRTSNGLDRLMDYQDRILYAIRYFHGDKKSALLYLRAMALIWNFHPYCPRVRPKDSGASPFVELNGFQYHSNWLQNMLVAASLKGWRR